MRPPTLTALLVSAALLAGCGGSQKSAQAPREERIAELEARVEALERALDAMKSRRHVTSSLVSRLDEQESRIAAIEKERGGRAPARPTRRRRPRRPKPNEVYAVPIGSSPCVGAKHARVTMIQAFEFA